MEQAAKPDAPMRPPLTVVSGGQTGVDRAALDAATEAGLPTGGWCPKGRRAEDGTVPARYVLREAQTEAYEVRTFQNVRDSDATLALTRGEPTGGTAYTVDSARRLGRPCLVVDARDETAAERIVAWLAERPVRVLNVAGPRESGAPGIHAVARRILLAAFTTYAGSARPPRRDGP